jgi:hypothetical protein
MAIQKEFVVRYRDEGHVRFQIPSRATQAEIAQRITDKIGAINGVYEVRIFRNAQKLVIRYHEAVCPFIELAKHLYAELAELELQGWFEPQALVDVSIKSRIGLKDRFKASRINRWFDDKITAAKETAQAAQLLGKLGSKGPKALFKDPEKAITDFLTDILVIYLIKIHWTRITQQWLVKPIVHRYEWMATFYMFYLLVRSRRPK